jgi:hypothetical protein
MSGIRDGSEIRSNRKSPASVLLADQGGKPTLALQLLSDRIALAARKGNHVDIGEHAVLDVDRRDIAAVVGVDEEDAAAIPEVLAVFFAGFDVQFQVTARLMPRLCSLAILQSNRRPIPRQ